jgi:hypothetical protein
MDIQEASPKKIIVAGHRERRGVRGLDLYDDELKPCVTWNDIFKSMYFEHAWAYMQEHYAKADSHSYRDSFLH